MSTEIFATFGPSCSQQQILKEMIEAGMTGMRLNLSHTMLSDSKAYIDAYKSAAKEAGRQTQILIDMQGPELRVGEIQSLGTELDERFNVLSVEKSIGASVSKTDTIYLQEGAWVGLCSQQEYLEKLQLTNSEVACVYEQVANVDCEYSLYKHKQQQKEESSIQEDMEIGRDVYGGLQDENEISEFVILGDSTLGLYFTWIPVPQSVLLAAEAGDEILLDDGKLLVQVEKTDTQKVLAKVLRGGKLCGRKSIKIVDKNVKMPPLTEHDIKNIKIAKEYGVTALMQPFVLCGEDLKYVRNVLKEHGAEDIQIYAKIENRQGVENIENILPEADVIIIARGDLGNDMPLWELPRVQKQIEAACKKAGKPYIVVTQMLASMENSPVPTRAEVSDIFHAVYHGAWGVMVTGETAIGKYPVEAVRYLANTAQVAEETVV